MCADPRCADRHIKHTRLDSHVHFVHFAATSSSSSVDVMDVPIGTTTSRYAYRTAAARHEHGHQHEREHTRTNQSEHVIPPCGEKREKCYYRFTQFHGPRRPTTPPRAASVVWIASLLMAR